MGTAQVQCARPCSGHVGVSGRCQDSGAGGDRGMEVMHGMQGMEVRGVRTQGVNVGAAAASQLPVENFLAQMEACL